MVQAAGVLVLLGVIGLIIGIFYRFKSARLAAAPFVKTGDLASRGEAVAGPKGAVSVQGAARVDKPLVAPASGKPCLFYEFRIVGHWKTGETKHSKTYVDHKMGTSFWLDDGSGPVHVLMDDVQHGDFDTEKSFSETKKEGFFAGLKQAVGRGEPIVFGQFSYQPEMGHAATEFHCEERILAVAPQMFALGKAKGNAIGAPDWTQLVLSPKTRDQLVGETAKVAFWGLVGGGAAAGVGAVLGLVSRFI